MKTITKLSSKQFNFEKLGGIIPAIIQDADTKAVLMLGFMNESALAQTIKNKKVCFYSRSKKRLWEKGETSGNTLEVCSITTDCDRDTLLILATPKGPTCHNGAYSCFGIDQQSALEFLEELYSVIVARKKESGEVIRAAQNESRVRLIEESADVLYHLLVLLAHKDISLEDVMQEMKERRK